MPGDERCKGIRVVDVACFDREILPSLELFRMAGDGRRSKSAAACIAETSANAALMFTVGWKKILMIP